MSLRTLGLACILTIVLGASGIKFAGIVGLVGTGRLRSSNIGLCLHDTWLGRSMLRVSTNGTGATQTRCTGRWAHALWWCGNVRWV